jgi:hypothetical protein
MAPQAAKAIQGLAVPVVALPVVITFAAVVDRRANRYREGGQTLIPKPASEVPSTGAQDPDACVGQSRSVVQMMKLFAPEQTATG